MVTFATLCYLRHGDKILILRKARGLFGEGKWNAPGGKLLPGESPENAAARETVEETGLKVSGLCFHGILNFYLGESRELDQIVFLFSSEEFTGEMRRSSEGELRWFSADEIPYDEMWEDDQVWLALLLDGKSFVGDFYFSEKYKQLVSHEIRQADFA